MQEAVWLENGNSWLSVQNTYSDSGDHLNGGPIAI